MSTAEIIAELPHLSATELAQVQAKLSELAVSSHDVLEAYQLRTPRLARPEQAKDFVKQILELGTDAQL